MAMPVRLRAAKPSGERSTDMWRAMALATGVISSWPCFPLLPSLGMLQRTENNRKGRTFFTEGTAIDKLTEPLDLYQADFGCFFPKLH